MSDGRPSGPLIETRPNGPYVVVGPISIRDADGDTIEVAAGQVVTLCRCGHSATKPFCDSTHKQVDFVSRPHFRPEVELPAPTQD